MPAPTALDAARTGTPDAATGTLIGTVISAESTATELPVGIAFSDHIASAVAAHRASLTSADPAINLVDFGSTPTCAELTNNRMTIAVWMEFASSCGRATVRPVYYDNQSTYQPIAVGQALSFTALELMGATGLSSCGDKLSPVQLIDSIGARRFKFRLDVLTNSTQGVDVFAVPI